MTPLRAVTDLNTPVNIALNLEKYFTVKVKKKMILTGED